MTVRVIVNRGPPVVIRAGAEHTIGNPPRLRALPPRPGDDVRHPRVGCHLEPVPLLPAVVVRVQRQRRSDRNPRGVRAGGGSPYGGEVPILDPDVGVDLLERVGRGRLPAGDHPRGTVADREPVNEALSDPGSGGVDPPGAQRVLGDVCPGAVVAVAVRVPDGSVLGRGGAVVGVPDTDLGARDELPRHRAVVETRD